MKKLIALFAVLASLAGCTQVDTGNVGVESALGQFKEQTLPPGVYFTLFKTVDEICAKEMPISLLDLKPQTNDKIALDDLDIDIYVSINPEMAAKMRTKWPGDVTEEKGEGCKRLGLNYAQRQAREVVNDVTTRFGSATIHLERTKIAAAVVKDLQVALDSEAGKGMFIVHSANVKSLETDKALQANIKAAAAAQFELQKEKNQIEVARITADRQRVIAQGEADAIRIKAEAVAKQGGAEYVQLQAIQKWDGKLPTTQAGGVTPFIQVK